MLVSLEEEVWLAVLTTWKVLKPQTIVGKRVWMEPDQLHQESVLIRQRLYRKHYVSKVSLRLIFFFLIFWLSILDTWSFFDVWLETSQTLFFDWMSLLRQLLLLAGNFGRFSCLRRTIHLLLSLLKAFLFLESLISLKKFGFPFILFDFL